MLSFPWWDLRKWLFSLSDISFQLNNLSLQLSDMSVYVQRSDRLRAQTHPSTKCHRISTSTFISGVNARFTHGAIAIVQWKVDQPSTFTTVFALETKHIVLILRSSGHCLRTFALRSFYVRKKFTRHRKFILRSAEFLLELHFLFSKQTVHTIRIFCDVR